MNRIRAALRPLLAAREHNRLLIIYAAAFLLSLGMGLTSPVVSLYAQSLGVSTSLVGVYITTFALGRILVTIPAGRAADRCGRRSLLGVGPLIIATAALGQALAPSYAPRLAFRLVDGLGSGLVMSAIYLSAADLTTPSERGRITGLFHTALLGGLTLGPAIGGVLAEGFGLAGPFFGTALLSLIIAPVLWLSLQELPRVAAQAETTAAPAAPRSSTAKPAGEPANAAGPLWVDPNFVLVALAGFVTFFARAGARDTILPLLGHAELGLGAPQLGVIFTAMAAMNLVAVPVGAQMTDRVGRKPTIFIGLMIIAGSSLLLAMTPSTLGFVLGALLMGFGKGFSEPASMVYMTDISSAGRYGASYGLFLTLRDVGLLAGPVVLSRIADLSNLRLPLLLNGGVTLAVSVLFVSLAHETLRRRQPTKPRA